MRTTTSQRGYSLMELVITMAISLIATTGAVLMITKFARTAGASREISTLEESRGTAESLLRADFDSAGLNLTRPSAPGAGKENVQFTAAGTDFNYSTPGALSKLTDNPAYAYSSRAVSSGGSLWSWTPATICKHCWLYLTGNDGSIDAIGTYYDELGGSAIVIYESAAGGYVATNFGTGVPIANHVPGDTYQIGVEAPNQQQQARFVRYYRIRAGVRTILYTSQAALPPYPHYMLAYLGGAGSSVNNITLIGAPITFRNSELSAQFGQSIGGFNSTEFAKLPFDGGTQLTSPITITGGPYWYYGTTATLLSGDKSLDPSPSLTTLGAFSTQIDLKTPQRGAYSAGDVVLIMDYGSNDPSNPVSPASAVCQVDAVTAVGSQTTRLTLTRSRQANPAWGRLWSSDSDHAHTFSPGSMITKLAPPITYTLSTDNRLVRIEGSRVETLAFNARQIWFSASTGQGGNQYIFIRVTMGAEGVETNTDSATETRGDILFSSTPKAFNLASNQLN